MAVFLFFKMAAAAIFIKMAVAAIFDFQNVEILGSGRLEMPKCITVPSFALIGQTVAEIWPFFYFSRWRPPPSWILKMWKF